MLGDFQFFISSGAEFYEDSKNALIFSLGLVELKLCPFKVRKSQKYVSE